MGGGKTFIRLPMVVIWCGGDGGKLDGGGVWRCGNGIGEKMVVVVMDYNDGL